MSGSSACAICGDIYYDPPQGNGPGCDCMQEGSTHYVFVQPEEYAALISRLALAEAVVAAAQGVVSGVVDENEPDFWLKRLINALHAFDRAALDADSEWRE